MAIQFHSNTTAGHSWNPAILSFLFHLMVLSVLVWLIRFPPRKDPVENIRRVPVAISTVDRSRSDEPALLDQPAATDREQGSGEITGTASDFSHPQPPRDSSLDSPSPTEFGSLLSDASGMADAPSRKAGAGGFSPETLKAIAAEQQELAGQPKPGPIATTSIFGSGPIRGRRFAFVLDRSNSMGSQGLNVLGRAESELMSALQPLTAEHSFQIIAYHQQTVSLNDKGLIPANQDNKNLVREFIDNLAPFGSTNHEAGLYTALALDPDIIILLTDGDTPELNDGQVQALVRVAGEQTTIHCIQFGRDPQEPGETFMRKIARQTGGSYRYIDIDHWNKEE